ncbi:MAG: hypothetical protein RL595_3419 [Planctomycetota bacterium]
MIRCQTSLAQRIRFRIVPVTLVVCMFAASMGCQNTNGGSSSSTLDKFFSPLPGNNGPSAPAGPAPLAPVTPTAQNPSSPVSDKDPLLGGGVPLNRMPSQTAQATTPGAVGNVNPQTGLPHLPAPASSTSPAALTTGNFSTLDPNRNPVTTVGATAAAGVGATSPFGAPEEFRNLMQQLTTRGLAWQRLDYNPQAGDWKFYCAVKDPAQPNATRNFETTAKTDVAALKAVLEEIDRTFPRK